MKVDMTDDRDKTRFFDVDGAHDPQGYVNCLTAQDKVADIEHYKRRVVERLKLQGGQSILDAGCGTGTYTLQARARLDANATMIGTAQQRNRPPSIIEFVQGDVHLLPFGAGAFDSCFSINTFQHLPDPVRALSELARVTRPGGQIVVADHELVAIDTPYPSIDRKFVQFRSASLKQGGGAHRLYGHFKRVGLVNVSVEAWTSVYTDYQERRVVAPYIDEIWTAERAGAVSADEARQWSDWLKAAVASDTFLSIMVNIITAGEKPR